MDYKKIMKESSECGELIEKDFNAFYERLIEKILLSCGVIDLQQPLREKRNMGLKKYAEDSFQSSMKNAMSSPTFLHAQEELLDCLNYLAHEYFKASLQYPHLQEDIKRDIELVHMVHNSIERMMKRLEQE